MIIVKSNDLMENCVAETKINLKVEKLFFLQCISGLTALSSSTMLQKILNFYVVKLKLSLLFVYSSKLPQLIM